MDNDIHKFLDRYFAKHGFSKGHENVRYVEHNFVEADYEEEMRKLVSGEMKAVFKISAWLDVQKIEPLGKDGILVLADKYGQAFAVVKIVDIGTVKFGEVSEELAKQFSIGDGSVNSWKECSAEFLSLDCSRLKVDFDDNTDILITWIEVVFPTDK